MASSLYRVQRVSDRKWLAEFTGWTSWEDSARTFSSKHDAEREARAKASGDYKIIEYVPNLLSR